MLPNVKAGVQGSSVVAGARNTNSSSSLFGSDLLDDEAQFRKAIGDATPWSLDASALSAWLEEK